MMIRRIQRQRNTAVVTIPKPIMGRLKAKVGDYLYFLYDPESDEVMIWTLKDTDNHDKTNSGNRPERDKAGRK